MHPDGFLIPVKFQDNLLNSVGVHSFKAVISYIQDHFF